MQWECFPIQGKQVQAPTQSRTRTTSIAGAAILYKKERERIKKSNYGAKIHLNGKRNEVSCWRTRAATIITIFKDELHAIIDKNEYNICCKCNDPTRLGNLLASNEKKEKKIKNYVNYFVQWFIVCCISFYNVLFDALIEF